MPESRIITGDCLEVLRTMRDGCADAIVTDPPYDLTSGGRAGFMGKEWDGTGIAFDPATWREALRVLKPGGYLLAFGGTRTYHRLACAIEDAGFEIRDSIDWLYSQGFPKSLNVEKALDEKGARCVCHAASKHAMCSVRDADVPATGTDSEGRRPVLLPGVPEQGAPCHRTAGAVAVDAGRAKPGVEGRRDVPPEARPLREDQVRAVPAGVPLDGEGGRVRDGAPARDGDVDRSPAGPRGGGSPRGPRPDSERATEPRTVAGQPDAQVVGAWPRCDGCGRPVVPEGLGTALKPAHEPIVLARKPIAGTVAANVLEHGTGALNVDGCRVVADVSEMEGRSGRSTENQVWGAGIGHDGMWSPNGSGRWPPNVLLTHDPECAAECAPGCPVAALDTQSEGVARFFPAFTWEDHDFDLFRYVAKASTRDRGGKWNKHPTVKPVALMRWLCRLVTPPGGIIVDPFAGSGTTLVAAIAEGFHVLGIEREAAYVEIAERRLAESKRLTQGETAVDT